MMFLQLWFEAASADYRGKAAFTAANIDLWWKTEVDGDMRPAPSWCKNFAWHFHHHLPQAQFKFLLASISNKEEVTFSGIVL